jgi:hypothetical protein
MAGIGTGGGGTPDDAGAEAVGRADGMGGGCMAEDAGRAGGGETALGVSLGSVAGRVADSDVEAIVA